MAGGEAGDCPAVVLLVEEEAGLLAVLEIDVVVDAVLADLGLGGGGVVFTRQLEPALALLEALFGTQGLVVPLVDAVDGLAVGPQDFGEEGKRTGFSFSMPTLRVWVTRMLLKRSTVRPGNWSASPKMTRQAERSAGSRTVLR